MSKIKIGIIGLGPFCSGYHIPKLLKNPDVEVTALCDISQERLDNRKEGLEASQTFTDYDTMLDPDLVDGVIVSTPNKVHFDPCKLALQRNIPTIVDKPITITVAEAEELVALSKSQNCILMTAFTRHFFSSVEHTRREIASGALTPQMLTAIQRRSPMKRGPQDGGMLHRRTVHIADTLPWMLGRPIVRVEGKIQYETDHTEETLVDMRLEFEGGLYAQLLCVRDCDDTQDEINVYGIEKSHRLERDNLSTLTRREGWQKVENLPTYGSSTDHFVDILKGHKPAPGDPYADLHSDDGLQAMRVIAAIHKAGQTGQTIDVPQ